jgi:hypothetical protein
MTKRSDDPDVIETEEGLLIVHWIPALPGTASLGVTTFICELEEIVHDASFPNGGLFPILALQV